jgi:hypothetical protein
MAMRFFLLLLSLALPLSSAFAQLAGGTITGRVLTPDGAPVKGAAVEVLGSSPRIGSYSREDGSYRIRGVTTGKQRIRVSARGFALDTFMVKVAGGEVALGITIKAAPESRREMEAGRSHRLTKASGAPEGISVRGGRAAETSVTLDAVEMSAPAPIAGGADGSVERSSYAAVLGASVADGDGGADHRRALGAPSAEPMPATSGAATKRATGTSTEPEAPTEEPKPSQPERPGQLTAGEWCDLHNWSYWLEIAGSEEWASMPAHWGFDPSSRISVIATDGERLIADAEVTLSDGQNGTLWRARTDNRGRAELFAGIAAKPAGTYRIEVRSGEAIAILNNIPAGTSSPVVAKLRDAAAAPTTLDLMFVIDCTGSMGDELDYIKSELESVLDRVRDNHSDRIGIRMSANFYRDHGDEYVVRSFPFTESSFEAIGQIRDQEANNGGDFPEAVEEALEDGIEKHDWSPSARARLMFLVLDAPPHYDEARMRQLQTLARRAAEKGIRIIPVASSGVDKETEFLMRLFAIYSGGTYTFLTDDSGIGNSHMKPTIGRHDVEYLDDLMVRLIGRWLEDVTISDEVRAALR